MSVNLDARRQFEEVLRMIENFTPEQKRQLQERLNRPIEKTYPGTGYAGYKLRFAKTGEFRAPKEGEWYLSGAIPAAYRALHDMITPYHIMKEVK